MSDVAEASAPEAQEGSAPIDFKIDNGIPEYQFGHWDTNLENFPFMIEIGNFKNGWVTVGDEPDGPIMAIVVLGAGTREGHSHFHNSPQIRIILEGSMQIGDIWYKKGDVRIQQAGKIYGPERVGPEGVTQLQFFGDRRAMFPQHHPKYAEQAKEGLDMFKAMMALSGINEVK